MKYARKMVSIGLAAACAASSMTGAAAEQDSASGNKSFKLEEIIVTARRREENLQNVPVAVTAMTQEALQQNNIQSVEDLRYFVPSLTLSNSGDRESPLVSIRGQGGNAPGSGPAVVSYLNEVPIPTDTTGAALGGPGLYYDLENIQVLKGPQGTLFGRSTTGGAILIQTKRPARDFGGHLQLGYGNYSNKELDAALNVPIIQDKLLVRVAVYGQRRDGFTTVQSDPTHTNGLDLDDVNVHSERLSVRFKPTDNFQNDLIYTNLRTNTNGTSAILSSVNTDPNLLAPGFGILDLYPDLATIFAQQQRLGIRTQVPSDVNSRHRREYWGITDIAEFVISDDLTLKNILGYSKSKLTHTFDADGTNLPLFGFYDQPGALINKQYSEEIQLQGKSFDRKLSWVTGALYLRNPLPSFSQVDEQFFGFPFSVFVRNGEKSKGAYAQGTYDLSSWVQGLKFTAGYRYSSDRRSLQDDPAGSVQNADFHASTWNLDVDYQVTPGTLLYVAARRGYRSGGFNSGFPGVFHTFRPEFVRDQEVGVKSDWKLAGMNGRTNVAVFHQDYKDIQTYLDVGTTDLPTLVISNAAGARIWGAEFEGILNPTRNLDLGLQFSWLDFKYTEFEPGTLAPDVLAASATADRPKYKYGVNARYHLPLSAQVGDASVSANWSWQDKQQYGSVTDPVGLMKAYGLLTLGANWNGIGGSPIDVSFFMTNALDKKYVASAYTIYTLTGTSALIYGEPRMYGVRLQYRFGAEGNK